MPRVLRDWLSSTFVTVGRRLGGASGGIILDYPVKPTPRWGYGSPPHQRLSGILSGGRERYRQHMRDIVALAPGLRAIPVRQSQEDSLAPAWLNPWFTGLDLAALYMLVTRYRPSRYIEIGSGWTTRIARRAARDAGSGLHITSIDPQPRADVDSLCDVVVRRAAEDVDLTFISDLNAGDILFLDSSHRVFTNSDCVIFFLEILPTLKPGVLVHLHDIFLPYDYPPELSDRYYSEQYLLAAWLLAEGPHVSVELPNKYVSLDPDLRDELSPLWNGELSGVQRFGGSFWLRASG